uniref:Kielin/chordin-like protein n=1 Tax=Scleropages formosus TaxID=113540 RepID=A0A8C9R025_SCLFO
QVCSSLFCPFSLKIEHSTHIQHESFDFKGLTLTTVVSIAFQLPQLGFEPTSNITDRKCIVDGRKYEEGSVWVPENQPCHTCICDGHVLCAPVKCPEVQCQNPIIPPGECCPVCSKGCHFQGRVYKNGSAFQMPTKQHVQCSCLVSNGTKHGVH